MTETADVVVVGGGIVGASAAYHLSAAGAGRVLLLERAPRLATGSTGACAGGFRLQFSSEVNIRLSLASLPLIVGFREEHGIPIDVAQDGYLFLLRRPEDLAAFRTAATLQRNLGVPVEELDGDAATELVPGIAREGLLGATYCPLDGITDPSGLTEGYAAIARRAGAEIRTGVEVHAVRVERGRVRGVETATGPIDAAVVVNAAGPWAAVLAATAGVRLPLEAVPRNVVVTSPFPGVPERRTLVIDAATSFYFHREGPGVLMGMGAPSERPSFDCTPDAAFIEGPLLETALRVFPPIERAGIARTWAGLYEMTPDRHPIVGPTPGLEGFLLANGFSGHGFQHAPIVGRLLAELVVDGRATTVDVAALSAERFVSGGVPVESHVV